MENAIKNKNLFIAEKLLEIINKDFQPIQNRSMVTLERNDANGLSEEEIIFSLKRLEDRNIVKFEDEEDKFDTYNLKYIDLYFKKNKLLDFIKTAKDNLYGITTRYSEDLIYPLRALSLILKAKYINKEIKFSELGYKYTEIYEWIADHSEAIKIIYELEPDVEWKDVKRPVVLGVSEVPKNLKVVKKDIIERLNKKIRELVIMPQQTRIKLFLKENSKTEWRCMNCKRFLDEISNLGQMVNYICDFHCERYKICYTCREKNCFSITPTGTIKFFSAKPKKIAKTLQIKKLQKKNYRIT